MNLSEKKTLIHVQREPKLIRYNDRYFPFEKLVKEISIL